jgi:hypothetical protein
MRNQRSFSLEFKRQVIEEFISDTPQHLKERIELFCRLQESRIILFLLLKISSVSSKILMII